MLATTLRSSTYLILGMILLTSLTGCSGCQQQTTVEPTSTEDAADDATETSQSNPESPPTTEEVAENPSEKEDAEPASNGSEVKAQTASASTQEAAETQASGGMGERDSSDRKPSTPAMSATQALTEAKELYTSAKSNDQAPGTAFQKASKAWELLNQHPDNAECKAMAAEIARSLGSMATQANQKYRTELSGDPVLIEK